MTPLHQQARALAAAGIRVFPCVVGSKRPAIEHSYRDATIDLAAIDRWWGKADYNLALCPEDAGWCVIDIDPGGETAWVALLAQHSQHEPTYEVETPRGGRHLYFAGSLPASVHKLGAQVDTRGQGSYVLVPPSVVNGKPYRVLYDRDIAAAPPWIKAQLARGDQRTGAAFEALDTPGALGRARRLLAAAVERGDVAIAGCGGNNRTYQLSAELLNLGLSVDRASGLLLNEWNPHCQPPWDNDELAAIVNNASSYAQNEPGAWAVGEPHEVFGQSQAFREALASSAPKRPRFHLRDEDEQDEGKEPSWLVPSLIPEAATVLMVGPTQSYKSFLALDLALSIAQGTATFGVFPSAGLSIYAALEGLRNIETQRRRAWRVAHEVTGKIENFYTMPAPAIGFPGEMQEFGDQIRAGIGDRPLKLIVIDTLSKSMAGLNENDSRDAGAFVRFCDSLVEAFGCSVIAIHHTGKEAGRGARGSSAFHAGFDTVLEVVKLPGEQRAVEVWVRKHKDAEERGLPWTFKGVTVGQSLVFQPTTPAEHRGALQEADEWAPAKIGRALVARQALSRKTAITSPELLVALRGADAVGDEKGARILEKLAKTTLRAYCEEYEGVLLWYIDRQEG